jgi:hypothetical protein
MRNSQDVKDMKKLAILLNTFSQEVVRELLGKECREIHFVVIQKKILAQKAFINLLINGIRFERLQKQFSDQIFDLT